MIDLDLAPIGNCSIASLIDRQGRHVWCCAPRVDSDPVFSLLLSDREPEADAALGVWAVDMEGLAEAKQGYLRNTPILRTELIDENGCRLEIIDFAPRYRQHGRVYRPTAMIRLIRPLGGAPMIRIRLRPAAEWGARPAERTSGSNHIRYAASDVTLRLTTDCPVSHILTERWFRLEEPLALFLGPDEPFDGDISSTCNRMLADTRRYWMEWVRTLAVPLEWQTAVIRAAITLKLCAYEETGAIVAALTTSIPEHADSGRNWDYRYCWVRDAYYVVQALNRLGAVDILENYLNFLRNLVARSGGGKVQPVYGVGLEPALTERIIDTLPGYRGMGPVRCGNQAHEHDQHDAYGQIVLSSVQAFFDERLLRTATVDDFRALEQVGERAFALYDQPDAGLWEFRTRASVHTYSSLMCWAACDRLANAAQHIAPPLQADFTGHRLAGKLPRARDLEVERVERVERAAVSLGRKQRRQEAVLVAGPHQFLAMIESVRHFGTIADSLNRNQARRDAASFAEQDVVGRDSRPRPRRLDVDLQRTEAVMQRVGYAPALDTNAQ